LSSNLPDDLAARLPLPDDLRQALARAGPRLGAVLTRLLYFGTVSSTNDMADSLAARGAADETILVAEAQRAGHGRRGRTWHSPPGAGLYVSLVWRLDLPVEATDGENGCTVQRAPSGAETGRVPLLTVAAGLAVVEGLRAATALPAEIKWPNDIVIGRRKLGGILAEASARGPEVQYIVLGCGLNLRAVAYPPDIAMRATSVEAELGRAVDRGLVLAEVLAALRARRADLAAGRFGAILNAWRLLAPSSRGSRVEWRDEHGTRQGMTDGVDDSGALLVRVGGRTERIIAGELRWL
jgi:BirA family biotin operon repressor/biotin-[acetyl-CoA-carboxylase] ligase